MEKQKFILSLVLILAVTMVLGLALWTNQEVSQQDYTMTVSAEGESVAKPDVAIINVGVKTLAKMKVEDVISENTKKMNSIIKVLKDSGIKERDIKTVNYNLYPVYDYIESRGRVLKGYELSQSLRVKIRDMETIGDTIDLATRNGANDVSSVSFTIDDPEELKNEAREEAIEKAKTKAKSMAKISGINLGRVVNVSENFGSAYPVAYNNNYSARAMGGVEMVKEESANIQVGESEISVTVSLTYEVK
jgi:uncharacterized protein